MRTLLMTLILCAVIDGPAFCQLNIELLHQLVAENKAEFAKQTDARNNQSLTTANEAVNKTKMAQLKTRYRELKNRFHAVGLAITAAQIGLEASPIISEIIRQQEIIYQQAENHPILIAMAFQSETDLAYRARMLVNYLYGLALSLGDLNQMKASDRKVLFGQVITELRAIEGASRGLAINMARMGRQSSANPFTGFINQDKQMVDEIIRKAKILKP